MKSLLRAVDQFSGAGGFSEALATVIDPDKVDLFAVNHWQTAVDSHEANHPKWRAEKHDVFHVKEVRHLVNAGEALGAIDLLMTSPTCTYFSRARGGQPLSWDQRWGRMTPTQVERWAKELRPTRIILENVPEFEFWGPVCRREKGCAEHGWAGPKPGETKRLFCGKAIRSRRGQLFRAFVKRLRRQGYRVEWRILNAADFGDATTRRRFFLLARRDGLPIVWPEPTHAQVPTGNLKPWTPARAIIDWKIRGKSIFTRKKPLKPNTLRRIYAGLVRFNWPPRFVLKLRLYMESLGIRVPDVAPARAPSGQRELFGDSALIVLRNHADAQSLGEPLPPVLAGGTHLGLVVPQGSNTPARTVDGPIPTVVAIARTAVVTPFTFANQTGNRPKSIDEPTPPTTTGGSIGLVAPPSAFINSQASGGAPRSVDDPLQTFPTRGAHALITPYYGTSAAKIVEDPLGTATTHDRFALVVPVTHGGDTSRRERSTGEPLQTVTGAPRGELAFVVGAFGERPGQEPRTRSIDDPAPTICAKGRVPIVHGVEDDLSDIDILFRMLEPHELAAAMGFPKKYRFKGNKGEKTRQIGNAVPVATAAALIRAMLGPAVPLRAPRARRVRSA